MLVCLSSKVQICRLIQNLRRILPNIGSRFCKFETSFGSRKNLSLFSWADRANFA